MNRYVHLASLPDGEVAIAMCEYKGSLIIACKSGNVFRLVHTPTNGWVLERIELLYDTQHDEVTT